MSQTAALKRLVVQSLQRISEHKEWKQPSCILLSGGLDSDIIAEEGGSILSLQGAISTIASPEATDKYWAQRVAHKVGLKHHIVETDLNSLLGYLPELVAILKTFDSMELRNSLAIFVALKKAVELGYSSCVTGDGADELFGGYSFTHRLDSHDFIHHRNKMIEHMRFSSFTIGRQLGLSVFSPYLDPDSGEIPFF
eukprot:jgi/Galph1/5693/GphlegSOOS_G4305.1